MNQGNITNESRILQIVQGFTESEINASLIIAIQNMQNQLNVLRGDFNEFVATTIPTIGVNIGTPSVSQILQMTNKSGAVRNNGELVIISSFDQAFSVTTVQDVDGSIGVVYSDSPDGIAEAIADDDVGDICVGGVANVKVDADVAAITAGDRLI